MVIGQNVKYVEMVPCQAVASNATAQTNTVSYCDTLGYDHLAVVVALGVAAATNHPLAALKLQQSDDTNASNFAEATGFVNGTDFTTPTSTFAAVTNITQVHAVFSIPLQGRKRYWRPVLTPNTTGSQLAHVMGILTRGQAAPTNASGVGAQVFVTPS